MDASVKLKREKKYAGIVSWKKRARWVGRGRSLEWRGGEGRGGEGASVGYKRGYKTERTTGSLYY